MQTPTTYHELFNMLSRQDIPFVRPNAAGEITLDDANKLLTSFAQLEDLHFNEDNDGCGPRTSLMQNLLKAAGVKALTLMLHYDDTKEWKFHFSPGVFIQDTTELYVIDPTTEKIAIPISTWASNNDVTVKDIIQCESNGTRDPDTALRNLSNRAIEQQQQQRALKAA